MISTQQTQERRLDELLRRQLGPRILAAIDDPNVTEIIVNEDGRVWFESYAKGMHEAGLVLAASQVESLIGTVASSLGSVVNSVNPIVEGELLIGGIRFEGLLPPVARKPCCVMRKPAQVLYTLDDYVRDEILSDAHAGILREAVDSRQQRRNRGRDRLGQDHAGGRAHQRNGGAFRSERALRDHRGHPRNPMPREEPRPTSHRRGR